MPNTSTKALERTETAAAPSAAFEVVKRPSAAGNVPEALITAIKETVNSDKAVRLTLDKESNFTNWQGRVRAEIRKDGLKLRARYNKMTHRVTCWAEPYDAARLSQSLKDEDMGVEEDEDANED